MLECRMLSFEWLRPNKKIRDHFTDFFIVCDFAVGNSTLKNYFPNLLMIHMITPIIPTTIRIPTQTPALNMPSTSSHPANSCAKIIRKARLK